MTPQRERKANLQPQPVKAQPQPVKALRLPKVQNRIEEVYDEWKGVPYEWGGESKQGIDCSALVQNIYQDAFDRRLPRVAELQVQAGSTVTRQQLRPGDLVFFRPGGEGNHVGVYAGDREFIHASVSEGVTRTRFDDYWQRWYWTSRRVLGPSKVPDSLAPQLVAYRYPDSATQAPRDLALTDQSPSQDSPAEDDAPSVSDTTIVPTNREEPSREEPSSEEAPASGETDGRVRIAARSDTSSIPSCADANVQCGARGGEGAFGDTTFVSPDTTDRMGW